MQSATAQNAFSRLATALVAAISLSGCVSRDDFGNPVEPMPSAIMFQPVKTYVAASHAAVEAWCQTNKGVITADHDACIWTWDSIRENDLPCLFVFAPHIPADRKASDERFMRSICNGWSV